jgi:hypothetical protein
VPLSEHEQRLLEQMERALYAEDPKLASTLRGSDLRAVQRKRLVLGAFGLLAGLGLLVTGVATQLVAIGVVGFLVMLAAAWYAYTGLKAPASIDPTQVGGTASSSSRGAAKRKPKASGTSMQRLEERWRRRREGDDRQ